MTTSPLRLVIIGGVAGGATAAARARRLSESAQITLIERGPDISFANCGMPYYLGGVIENRSALLVQTVAGMKRRYGVDVRVGTEAMEIDRASRRVRLRDLASGSESQLEYDYLILSPGAHPIVPDMPGADDPSVFALRSLGDMDAIDQAVRSGAKAAVIVGAGYIGLEMAENLRHRGLEIKLIERTDHVMSIADVEMTAPLHAELRRNGIELHLNMSVKAIERENGRLQAVLADGRKLDADFAIMSVGVKPESTLARNCGLELAASGGIVVDEHMRTTDERIYAVGDAVEVRNIVADRAALVPLAGPANRQGRIAADNIFGRPSAYHGSQGTAICKVFDLAIGMTGLTEQAANKFGIACEKVYIHPASHAGYFPGAAPLTLKLLFSPTDGKVLGAQAIGTDGVDKRIDVLAVAIRAGMSVYDLQDLELSYAPPYGSAKDPVNYAGFVAANALAGDVRLFHARDALAVGPGQVLLDVRTPAEVSVGMIPGAMCMPLDELRSRLGELPRDKEFLVYCQVGLRGYLACRTLSQNGLRCRNLSGGFKTFQSVAQLAGQAPASVPPRTPMQAQPSQQSPSACAGRPCSQPKVVKEIDATCMQCPGPIMRLASELATLASGDSARITTNDPGFAADVKGWCDSTGDTLAQLGQTGKAHWAIVTKGATAAATASAPANATKRKTILVFSSDFERVFAAFILANGAAAMGSEVTLFFTFWGLNALRRSENVRVPKTFIERMFGWMMPRGAGRLSLSKMHMGGVGKKLMLGIMKDKGVSSLEELIASAKQAGVKLVACSMSMDVMGIHPEELIDGVEQGGVSSFLATAEQGSMTLCM